MILSGGMQDYNYRAAGVMELTLEISCCKFPAAAEIDRIWDENKESMLNFLLQINNGKLNNRDTNHLNC